MTFNIFSNIYLAYLLSRYSYVPNIASFQFWEKLPNYERHNKSNSSKKYNWSKVISLENSIIVLRHISCAQVHLSSERNEGRAIRFMHERSFYGSEFPSFFPRDNGLFLTRGASQNLRKRCHGKKKRGEQISPWSYGLCISCMARHPFQRLHPDATRRRK